MLRKSNRQGLLGKLGVALLLAGLFMIIGLQHAPSASAATSNGITVTPARLNFSLSKDAPSQRMTVTLTNNYTGPVTLAAEFKGIDEDAGILVPTNDIDVPLADALKLSETTIRLLPNQPYQLTVQLNNNSALAPGGHYATLVLTQQNGPSNGLALQAAVSLAIFATKNEGAKQSLQVDSFMTNGWLFRMPSTATLDYHNVGNVHLVPRAEVVVAESHSLDPLKRGVSNQNSVLLLPDKTWQDTIPVTGIRNVWLPKKLQIVAAYRADGATVPQRIVQTSWYVPPVYPLAILLITGLVWIKRYRQKSSGELTKPLRVGALLKGATGQARTITSTAKTKLRKAASSTRASAQTLRISQSSSAVPPSAPQSIDKESPITKAKTTKKVPKKSIKVKDAKPLITLASLEQRTTRVTPKKTNTAAKTGAKKSPKTTKTASKTTKKPVRKPAKKTPKAKSK